MPTTVERVSNASAQGTRWRATPNAHQRKDQTITISEKNNRGKNRPEVAHFFGGTLDQFYGVAITGAVENCKREFGGHSGEQRRHGEEELLDIVGRLRIAFPV